MTYDRREVPWTIRPAIGDREAFEMDVTYVLAWDDTVGWAFDGVIVHPIEGDPISIDRHGMAREDQGWTHSSPLCKAIQIAAERCFDVNRYQITADLPTHWPRERPDYADHRQRRIGDL